MKKTQIGKIQMNDPIFEGKHIVIVKADHVTNGHPSFYVYNKHDKDGLGSIAWFAKWKKYVYYPVANTCYEWHCLRDIANFLESSTGFE